MPRLKGIRFLFLFLALHWISVSIPMAHAAIRDASTSWWKGAVFYEIFVRSFQDSKGDGTGDLRGITARLDYLSELGIQGIWLTPIFKSPSYHGYDATNYTAINPDFGSLQDLQELVRQAHARGIRILLDLAINHTSTQNPWYIEASRNPGSPYRDWYLWMNHDPGWHPPLGRWYPFGGFYYYSTFGPDLADLNWLNPQVRTEMARIMDYWLSQGIDGFRLDAARYYVKGPEGQPDSPGTHRVIREFVHEIKAQHPKTLFIGEVWADANTIAPYVNSPGELDMAFHFPESSGLVDSLLAQRASGFVSSLEESLMRFRWQDHLAPFLTNHDMVRLPTQVEGQRERLKLAAAALLTLPGSPFLYYGEEIGMPQGPHDVIRGSDAGKRTPMIWTNDPGRGFTSPNVRPWMDFSTQDPAISVRAQAESQASLLRTYQSLIRLRRTQRALSHGSLTVIPINDPRIAAYIRKAGREMAVVVLNFSPDEIPSLRIDLPIGSSLLASQPVTETLWGSARSSLAVPSPGMIELSWEGVPSYGAAIQKLTFH